MSTVKFAIVGAGIGGLTLAIALQKRGFDVRVYENAPEIKPLGAGLALASNAVKAFMEIGVSDEVLRAGKIIKTVRIKNTSGNILTETNAEKLSAKFGIINSFTIHRADLHSVLMSQLKPGTLWLNKGCVDVEQQSGGITLKFHDGTLVRTDHVIACDGIHSMIRKKLLPDSHPRYAGYTCWRAVTDFIPEGVDMNETSETWGAGSRFGVIPLCDGRIYWFACVNAKANDPEMRAYRIPDLYRHFGHYHFPIPEIIKNTSPDQLIWSDIIDIKPLKKFAFGNIVLMGDAAHATTPNLGQGACMAIEDAAVLANCLEQYLSPEQAFQQFEKKRILRTTTIVKNSWRIGQVAQWENPLLVGLRNAAIRLTPSSFAEKQVRFLSDVSFM
ncbi:MAG: FAD-dependent monooxygenase [Bacteroidota bacterium]